MIFAFDMDGTLFDLYHVKNWLPRLRAEDPTPYIEAAPMVRFSQLARFLNKLQRDGHEIVIISWTSKEATDEYHRQIAWAKYQALRKHLPSVHFNRIIFAKYNEPKEKLIHGKAVLFDDDPNVRAAWGNLAFPPEDMMGILHAFY